MKKLTGKQTKALINSGYITKDGKISKVGETAKYINELAAGEKVRQLRESGRGRNTKYEQVAGAYRAQYLLKLCGYDIKQGNDAPRGGAMGDFYQLARKVNASAEAIEAQLIAHTQKAA